LQHAQRSKENSEEKIEETAHAYFSHCPFCSSEYSMNYEENPSERYIFCKDCRRRWNIRYTMGTIWFLRTADPQQNKEYTIPWILKRVDRSLEGIRPYLLLEDDYSKIGKQKVVEHGLDRLIWKVERLLEYFDRYDRLNKRHSCERIKIAFACARMKAEEKKEAASGSGLSIKQVAAVTNISEYEASKCTQQLLDHGSISYDVRPEKGLTGVEAVITSFLGEPLYQMNKYTAEKTIKELIR
jgi:hypothetical protein